VFSGCHEGRNAEAILSESGLKPDARQILDPAIPVTLTIWRENSGNT
jgi:hypothetical protein